MAFIALEPLGGSIPAKTTTFTLSTATAITTDSATTAYILAQLGASGNYTTVAVTDGIGYEFMHITGVSAGALTVDRAQGGTSAVNLNSGASIRYIWLTEGVIATAPGGSVTCAGSGATTVTGGPNYNISSPIVAVTAGAGITVSGAFPSFHITNTAPTGATGPAGATGATGPTGPSSTLVTGTGLAAATAISGGYNVDVPSLNLVGGTGISISGVWPNITVTNTQAPGGTGTVTSVAAGTGITITGTPTINPTVALSATGITPGAYGAITLNAAGQITAIAANFFTNLSTSTTGAVVANPSAGVWTVNIGTASTGTQGLVRLATATSGGSNNAGDATSAVTPAGVNAVVNSLSFNPASFAVFGTQVALGAGSYTNAIGGLVIPILLAAGKSALIDLYVEVYDSAATTTPQAFGIGLFNGGSLLAGVSDSFSNGVRYLKYLATGPLTATLTVNTTTLAGTQTLGSYYASVTNN